MARGALDALGSLWRLARKIEELFELNEKINAALAAILARLDAIERRITQIEADQRQLVSEARSASTAAASMVAGNVIAEAITRLTRIEGRLDRIAEERKALPPRES